MLELLTSLSKAAIGLIVLPVAVVADAITLGGTLTDKDDPYTTKAVSDVVQNLNNATDPKRY